MANLTLPNFFGSPTDLLQDFINSFTVQWGIFNAAGESVTGFGLSLFGGNQSFFSINYTQDTSMPTFPVERGSFASYNKINLPNTTTVVLNLTGNKEDRTAFLRAIDNACLSTELYTIITPEVSYFNRSIKSYNYIRSAQSGCSLLSVQLFLMEVRQVTVQLPDTQGNGTTISGSNDPTNSSPKAGGQVQGSTPNSATQSNVNNQVAGG